MNPASDLRLSFELLHPPRKVWRALTQPELLSKWLMSTDSFVPEVGRHFLLSREPVHGWDGVVQCRVLVADEPYRLSYTWQALGVDTVVTFTLEETAQGTRLVLEQTGFRPDQKQASGGAKSGWKHMAGEALVLVLNDLS